MKHYVVARDITDATKKTVSSTGSGIVSGTLTFAADENYVYVGNTGFITYITSEKKY